ncbi:MAG: hypothetical protein IT214_09615 [Chitinophagaceae bacterium]|jgi:hypothetical protein|nr:hypothetical protein [Chitinophagaceae bacterium]OQY92156.1 MAG: hypothetical protein B6D37_15230 [Sphingobacteriales bacterium UTBCD1]
MINVSSTEITKALVMRYLQHDADYKKRSLYLQEIISMGRKDQLWIRALAAYFDSPMDVPPIKSLCKN